MSEETLHLTKAPRLIRKEHHIFTIAIDDGYVAYQFDVDVNGSNSISDIARKIDTALKGE